MGLIYVAGAEKLNPTRVHTKKKMFRAIEIIIIITIAREVSLRPRND